MAHIPRGTEQQAALAQFWRLVFLWPQVSRCIQRPRRSRRGHPMNNVVGHLIILAGAGVAACALTFALGRPDRAASSDEAAVVVTLPQRAGEPAIRAPVGQSPKPAWPPGDRVSLVRELQRELKRVGCYEGEISGVWTPSSRMAMKGFTDQVNAKLPIDQPDHILLKLVQNHKEKACLKPCSTGQAAAHDGRCTPGTILA